MRSEGHIRKRSSKRLLVFRRDFEVSYLPRLKLEGLGFRYRSNLEICEMNSRRGSWGCTYLWKALRNRSWVVEKDLRACWSACVDAPVMPDRTGCWTQLLKAIRNFKVVLRKASGPREILIAATVRAFMGCEIKFEDLKCRILHCAKF